MTAPILVPRDSPVGVYATWGFAGVFALVVALTVSGDMRTGWYLVGLGAAVLFAFVANMIGGGAQGFFFRVSAAVVGGAIIMGIIAIAVTLGEITTAPGHLFPQ